MSEFFKIMGSPESSLSSESSLSGTVEDMEGDLPEGAEGHKAFVEVKIEHNERERSAGRFVKKEYDSREDVSNVIHIANILRNARIPVPVTMRYFEEEGNDYLLVSDLTKDGESIVSSINNTFDLDEMLLDEEDFSILTNQVSAIVRAAHSAGYFVGGDAFFVVKDVGERPHIVIGDFGSIRKNTEKEEKELTSYAMSQVEWFTEDLRYSLERNKRKG